MIGCKQQGEQHGGRAAQHGAHGGREHGRNAR